jgi:Asp-tRNA(Asn)/Glu-tRNA(Gln) amidotransferase A subunit family amidase
MNEFAYGLDGKNAHSGDCPHPWFPDRISGGSSSGSAWAVARGIVPLAFGTDTGGSIRVPAALSGVPGFRRPVDSWASHGVFPLARSFDTVGWFTATASDMEESIASLFGEQTEAAEDSIRGVYVEPAEVPIAGELRERYGQAVEELEMRQDADIGRAFAEIVGKTDELLESYNVIGSTEAYEVHAAWLDRHRELYDPGVWSLIDRGRHWSRADMDRARERQSTVSAALTGLFQDADALVMPAVHTVAPKHEEVDAAFRRNILALTAPASLAGLAVLTLPVFAEGGESVDAGAGRARLSGGLQCILAPGRETTVARRLLRRYFPKSFSM